MTNSNFLPLKLTAAVFVFCLTGCCNFTDHRYISVDKKYFTDLSVMKYVNQLTGETRTLRISEENCVYDESDIDYSECLETHWQICGQTAVEKDGEYSDLDYSIRYNHYQDIDLFFKYSRFDVFQQLSSEIEIGGVNYTEVMKGIATVAPGDFYVSEVWYKRGTGVIRMVFSDGSTWDYVPN